MRAGGEFIYAAIGEKQRSVIMGLILLVILVLLLMGSVPQWPYSRNWGYGPSGVLGLLLTILIILMILRLI
jgi:hypothetical protein